MLGPEEMREFEEHVARHEAAETAAPSAARGNPPPADAPIVRLLRAVFPFGPHATRR